MTASTEPARQSPFDNPHLLLTATAFIWGGNAIAGKLAIGHISPMMLTCFRWTVGLAIVWAIAWPHLKRDWPVIRTRLPYLFAMGAMGYTGFNVLLYTALKYTSAINVVIEQSAMPLVIFLGNLLIFRVAVTLRQVLGFLLTMVGVVLVVSGGNPLNIASQGLNFGDLLMVFAVIAYSAYTIALRAKPDMHWKSFFACLATAACITSVPAAAYEVWAGTAIFPVTTQGWLVGLYAALLPSIVAQIFFIRGVEQIGGNLAGLYINLVPIFGTGLAILIVGETFGWHQAVALVLVVGGILYAQTAKPKQNS